MTWLRPSGICCEMGDETGAGIAAAKYVSNTLLKMMAANPSVVELPEVRNMSGMPPTSATHVPMNVVRIGSASPSSDATSVPVHSDNPIAPGTPGAAIA